MQPNHPKAYTPREEDKERPTVTPDPIPAEDVVKEPVEAEAVEPTPIIGVVTDCLKLNVRSTPVNDKTGGNVVTTIDCLTEVVVDEDASTDKFYKICTASGVEGFCMKEYIAIRRQ